MIGELDMTGGEYRRIHSGYTKDRKFNRLGLYAEAIFLRLLATSDQWGNNFGESDMIKAQICPMAHELDEQRIVKEVKALCEAGYLCQYQADDGDKYLHIVGFLEPGKQAVGRNGKRVRKFPSWPGETDELQENQDTDIQKSEMGDSKIIQNNPKFSNLHNENKNNNEKKNENKNQNRHQDQSSAIASIASPARGGSLAPLPETMQQQLDASGYPTDDTRLANIDTLKRCNLPADYAGRRWASVACVRAIVTQACHSANNPPAYARVLLDALTLEKAIAFHKAYEASDEDFMNVGLTNECKPLAGLMTGQKKKKKRKKG